MSETKAYKLDGDLTVQFEEGGAYISSVNGSVALFLTWAELDALDEARHEAQRSVIQDVCTNSPAAAGAEERA